MVERTEILVHSCSKTWNLNSNISILSSKSKEGANVNNDQIVLILTLL